MAERTRPALSIGSRVRRLHRHLQSSGGSGGVGGVGGVGASAVVTTPTPLRGAAEDTYRQYIPEITEHYSGQGFASYAWLQQSEAPPHAPPLSKPLSECKIGLLGTSGVYAAGVNRAYSYKDDSSIRLIPSDTPPSGLHFSHVTENYVVAGRSDPSAIFPLGTLQRLAEAGKVGSVPEHAVSCMGGIYSTRRVAESLVPAAIAAFRAQEVDAVLIVPM